MSPAQKVMRMILENHRPIDVGEGGELKYVTTIPNVTQMKAYYPPKVAENPMTPTMMPGGIGGQLPNSGT